MFHQYHQKLLHTTIAQNHKTVIDLAIAMSFDPSLEQELLKVIKSLKRSNLLLTKLVNNESTTLRLQKIKVSDQTDSDHD